jgi:hypothetical protein
VRSHAVVVPSHPAGDLGGGGCGSAAAAHGSQASRRDRGVVAVPMTGCGEALRTRRIHARGHIHPSLAELVEVVVDPRLEPL